MIKLLCSTTYDFPVDAVAGFVVDTMPIPRCRYILCESVVRYVNGVDSRTLGWIFFKVSAK